MLVKETMFHFENIHYTKDEEEEDDDETLSLCDLPLYSNNDQSDESWEQDLTSSSKSSSQNDYFEFITQEYFNPSTAAAFPPENIIFCGKLFPFRDPTEKSSFQSKNQTCMKKNNGWELFRWKRCNLSRNGENGTSLLHKKGHQSSTRYKSPKKKHNKVNYGKGYDFPVHKMSILSPSSSGKARWYLFLFGLSRFSNEVELRDLKTRQSRRRQCPPPSQPTFSFTSVDENGRRGRNRGWGLWGLISALSCSAHHLQANAMVAASIGGAPSPK